MARKVLLENEVDPTEFVKEADLPYGTIVKDGDGDAWWKTGDGWLYLSRTGLSGESGGKLRPTWGPYTVLSLGGMDDFRQWED